MHIYGQGYVKQMLADAVVLGLYWAYIKQLTLTSVVFINLVGGHVMSSLVFN